MTESLLARVSGYASSAATHSTTGITSVFDFGMNTVGNRSSLTCATDLNLG